MQRKKLARFTAMALAAIMTLGGAITAMASDATSGTTTGEGTNEGHLDRQVVKVVLPTVSSDSTMFAYTMDLERLIQETQGAKYGEATFPNADVDTGVYFNVSGNYANTSETLKVTNESSVSINLTVEVEASEEATDVTLVSSNSFTGDDAQLYLALKVGTEETPIVAGEKVSSTVTIDGIANNFKIDVVSGDYVYAPVDSPAPWKTASFCLTGAANEASAEGLTAPTLTVTWRYDDPSGKAGTADILKYQNATYLKLDGDDKFSENATSVIVNGVDVTENATLIYGSIGVKASDIAAAGVDTSEGTTLNVTYTVEGTKYTASYTIP